MFSNKYDIFTCGKVDSEEFTNTVLNWWKEGLIMGEPWGWSCNISDIPNIHLIPTM